MGKRSKQKKTKRATGLEAQTVSRGDSQYFYWLILAFLVLSTVLIRFRLLSVPLERDEGEFAYMGQLILQGIPPYLISYNMKLPGIYAAYALIMSLFGQTVEGIHLGFSIVNAATIVLVYLLAKQLYDSYASLVAAASFAMLSLSPSLLGTSAHASHFVLLPALGGILVMLKAIDSNKLRLLFWSGILLGLSFLMKQPGIFFVVFAFLYVLLSLLRLPNVSVRLAAKGCSLYLLGAVIPFLLTCAILYRAGVLEKFWFWTFSYASQYVSEISLSLGVKIFFIGLGEAIGRMYLLWGIGGLGIVALFRDRIARTRAAFVSGFAVFSFLAVCPGFYFRQHYFIFFLPALALLIGIAISWLRRAALERRPGWGYLPTALFLAVFCLGIILDRSFYFDLTPVQVSRGMYGLSPFPESIEIAKYIQAHSKKEDKVAVLGSEPQIFFYSDRHSATGYIYTYPLMEDQKYALKMQKEMIEEIEKAQPSYLIFVKLLTSWGVRENSEKYIFRWYETYTRKYFNLVGIVDVSQDRTVYRWGDEAARYSPRSQSFVVIYKRNESKPN